MSSPLYAVYGVGGFGRQVMPLAQGQLQHLGIDSDRLVFVDDNPKSELINAHQVMRYDEFLKTPASERYVVLAMANGLVRENINARCQQDGVRFWTVRANNSVIADSVEIGAGAILSYFVLLTCNITIGRHFHANHYSHVSHDCVIGDYVSFGPGVRCNGNVVIEDHAYIGSGAVIKQGVSGRPLVIGSGAVVGMGAVVTKDVPAGATVIGNPARLMSKD